MSIATPSTAAWPGSSSATRANWFAARVPRSSGKLSDLLQAQHVEIGDAPRVGHDAGEVAAPIDAESPLDVPGDELHRTLSNPFGQVSRPVHHAHNFNATRHEPVYDQIISFDENTRP